MIVEALGRDALLSRLRLSCTPPKCWDVVVVGGGATGLGCAVDAASRGYSTLLLEANDFAKGTSSRATKLIHGGVRYLAQGNLALVREALAERAILLANAPELVQALRFVVPAYHWHEMPMLGAGLGFYDLLAGSHSLGHSKLLSASSTRALLPGVQLKGLLGGVSYWDAQFDDARLALALALTVHDQGGLALNYVSVAGLMKSAGRVCGVHAADGESGECFEVPARTVINATGVWADGLRALDLPGSKTLIRPSQGVHLVVDSDFLPGNNALLVPHTTDDRVLFVIPWQGKLLLGTTDTPRDEMPLEPRALESEIDYILETAARYLARAPRRSDVRSVFAGLRPLVGGAAQGPTRGLSREHLVEVSRSGMVTITGGKWTTYRLMATDAVDAAARAGALPRVDSRTQSLRLRRTTDVAAQGPGSGRESSPDGEDRLLSPRLTLSEAAVRHAFRFELARGVEDVLARRHRALFLDANAAQDVAPEVARIAAEELGRDAAWASAQVEAFRALASGYCAVPWHSPDQGG